MQKFVITEPLQSPFCVDRTYQHWALPIDFLGRFCVNVCIKISTGFSSVLENTGLLSTRMNMLMIANYSQIARHIHRPAWRLHLATPTNTIIGNAHRAEISFLDMEVKETMTHVYSNKTTKYFSVTPLKSPKSGAKWQKRWILYIRVNWYEKKSSTWTREKNPTEPMWLWAPSKVSPTMHQCTLPNGIPEKQEVCGSLMSALYRV